MRKDGSPFIWSIAQYIFSINFISRFDKIWWPNYAKITCLEEWCKKISEIVVVRSIVVCLGDTVLLADNWKTPNSIQFAVLQIYEDFRSKVPSTQAVSRMPFSVTNFCECFLQFDKDQAADNFYPKWKPKSWKICSNLVLANIYLSSCLNLFISKYILIPTDIGAIHQSNLRSVKALWNPNQIWPLRTYMAFALM